MEALHPLNSSFPGSPLVFGNPSSTFCFCDFDLPHKSGILQNLSFLTHSSKGKNREKAGVINVQHLISPRFITLSMSTPNPWSLPPTPIPSNCGSANSLAPPSICANPKFGNQVSSLTSSTCHPTQWVHYNFVSFWLATVLHLHGHQVTPRSHLCLSVCSIPFSPTGHWSWQRSAQDQLFSLPPVLVSPGIWPNSV
jgi:hypothetical protein